MTSRPLLLWMKQLNVVLFVCSSFNLLMMIEQKHSGARYGLSSN